MLLHITSFDSNARARNGGVPVRRSAMQVSEEMILQNRARFDA